MVPSFVFIIFADIFFTIMSLFQGGIFRGWFAKKNQRQMPGKEIQRVYLSNVYYTDFAVKSFRIYLCMMVLATVNKGTFIFLQSVGKAKESTIISMMREIVFGVGLAILLPRFFGLDGVLYSMPISDILAFVIAFYFITKTLKSLRSEELDYRTSPT